MCWCREPYLTADQQSDKHRRHFSFGLLGWTWCSFLRDELLARGIFWRGCLSGTRPGSEICENPCFPQWIETRGRWQRMGQYCQFSLTAVRCHPFGAWGGRWGGGGGGCRASEVSWFDQVACFTPDHKLEPTGNGLLLFQIILKHIKVQVVELTTLVFLRWWIKHLQIRLQISSMVRKTSGTNEPKWTGKAHWHLELEVKMQHTRIITLF